MESNDEAMISEEQATRFKPPISMFLKVRYHPLARHCDILTSIETRISMLNMTYLKFIDHGICCFIPGKVIDEIKRVLCIVETCKTPPRAHEVLQELRDISSMAIEHFDDKISPALRKKMQERAPPPAPKSPGSMPMTFYREMVNLRRRYVLNAKISLYLASHYKKFHKRIVEYKKLAWRQRQTIKKLSKKQNEQDAVIAELKKRIEECDIKYSEITHTNQAVGGKSMAAPSAAAVATTSAQPLCHFGSQIKLDLSVLPIGTSKRSQAKLLPNIKPRKSLIKLPSLSDEDDAPRAKAPKLDSQPPAPPAPSAAPAIPAAASPAKPAYIDLPESAYITNQSTIKALRGFTNELRYLTKGMGTTKAMEAKIMESLIIPPPDAEIEELDFEY